MNTGIQDAHNLAWKIACFVKGIAPSSILHTYESERKPVLLLPFVPLFLLIFFFVSLELDSSYVIFRSPNLTLLSVSRTSEQPWQFLLLLA